jgi:restriction endonuclease S subunit
MSMRPLDDIVSFFSGNAWKAAQFSDKPPGMPIIRIQNVGLDTVSEFKYWPAEYQDRFIIEQGDLLLTLSGSFRTVVWNGPRALLNQRIVKVTPRDGIDKRWLFHALDDAMERIANMGRWALVSNVALSDLNNLNISVPPLEEQRRIAGILDQADALRRLRNRALDKLNTLGQAIFHEMFGDFLNSKLMTPLAKLTTKIGSGATPRGGDAAYKDDGVPLIRSMNVRDGSFDRKGLAFLDDDQAVGLKNVIVQGKDVLLNMTGASVARVSLAPVELTGARVNQHVAIIRPLPELLPEFLEAFLLLPSVKRKLLGIAEAGATRQAITKAQIEEFKVPLIPLKDQSTFVARRNEAAQMVVTCHLAPLAVPCSSIC